MVDDALRPARVLLERCESLLACGEAPAAFAGFRDVLASHRTTMARDPETSRLGVPAFVDFAGRVIDLWTRLAQSPHWNPLTDPALGAFLCELTEFYQLAGACADDRLDRAFLAQLQIFNATRQPGDFLRVLLLWAPSSRTEFSPFLYLDSARTVVVAQALASVALLVVCAEREDRARNDAIALLASGRIVAGDLLPFAMQPVFFSAWFRCSYACVVNRHAIKRVLNETLVSALGASASAARPPLPVHMDRPDGDVRPCMVVPLEWAFNEEGAMYRCYAPVLRDLRRHFFTVGMSERRAMQPAGVALFDQYICFEDVCPGGLVHEATVAAAIRTLRPTCVFYPSVGMARSVVLLANQRLAPVQAMTVGHPASSFSACMDYMLVERGFVGDPAIFSETLVSLVDGALSFAAPLSGNAASAFSPDAGALQVAVPAVAQKLSWPFLAALRRASDAARRPIRFHFFTGLVGTTFLEVARRIESLLPGSRVYAYMDYLSYGEKVAACQVHAASFPFGGTNSVIDSLRSGLPVVALRGREVHERIDAEFLRRLDFGADLVADSAERYVAILVRLADDPEFLAAMQEKLRRADVEKVLMSAGRPEEYSDALLALCRAAPARID